MVQEFGVTREIEDRVLAPLPVSLVAIEKIVSGALQGLFAALIVFPIAAIVPATPVHLKIHWLDPAHASRRSPASCASALGLTFGTVFDPRTVPMLFGVIVLPITFLGCIYYTWASLDPIRWLQITDAREPARVHERGLPRRAHRRAHMSLWAVYPVVIGFTVLLRRHRHPLLPPPRHRLTGRSGGARGLGEPGVKVC